MRRLLAVAFLVLLVGTGASACEQEGTVIGNDTHGGIDELCDLTIRPDGVTENGDPKPVFRLRDMRRSVCERCPVHARWPECAKPDERTR